MPFYDYKCEACGHEQEEMHKINDTPEIRCSKCDSVMSKTFKNAPLAKFKGNGFWATDGRLDHLVKKEPPIGQES